MYRIMSDPSASGEWEHLYHQGDDDYTAFDVCCTLTMGDSGSLALTVPKTNPNIKRVQTRKTLLDFQRDGKSLGIFEVREISHDINGNAEIYAVGEMAWLFDSVQPQKEYHNQSARQFISSLLSNHNAQCPDHRFFVGVVNVTDSNDSLYRYTNREQTLDALRDKLSDRLGGYFRVRKSGGMRYLDYVDAQTYGSESEQTIRFGENILDYTDNYDVSDICTELVPLGARLENDAGDNSRIGNLEQRVEITTVNDGDDYIVNNTLVNRFGHIRTTRTWDDVTVPSNLLTKARRWLNAEQFERMHITVRAVDLSMSDSQFGELRMGDRAYVVADELGMRRPFPIYSRTYHPDDPTQDVIELGDSKHVGRSYVSSQVRASSETARKADEHEHIQAEWLKSAIENVTAMMTGSRGGYKLTEYDTEGRWLADYIMDSADKSTAMVVKKVTVDGTAYSRTGIDGPYDTAILANGTILGKYIQAGSIQAEQISQTYTSMWQSADTATLNTARTEFKAADGEILGRVSRVETQANGLRTDLSAEIKVRADQIATKVTRGQISSTIEQTAETIFIKANHFGWQATNSSMSTDGTLTAKNANITGVINATSGKIGGMSLDNKTIYNDMMTLMDNGLLFKRRDNKKPIGGMFSSKAKFGNTTYNGIAIALNDTNGDMFSITDGAATDLSTLGDLCMVYARKALKNTKTGKTVYAAKNFYFMRVVNFENVVTFDSTATFTGFIKTQYKIGSGSTTTITGKTFQSDNSIATFNLTDTNGKSHNIRFANGIAF